MRRYSANYVYTVTGDVIRNGIVGVDEDGKIVEIIDPHGEPLELSSTEFHNGVIVPGFINTHCHTELSHFRKKTSPGAGLSGFVEQIRNLRIDNKEEPQKAIDIAISEMYQQGVVAVADICNTSDSFYSKQRSTIRFVNLIEVLGLDSGIAEFIMERARFLKSFPDFKTGDFACITPHSTYTLSKTLWELAVKEMDENNIISIHYAESKQEEELTEKRTGALAQAFSSWGLTIEATPKGKPLDIVKSYLPSRGKVLFVHNTFLTKADAENLILNFPNAHFSFCPSSNLFIENTLPDVEMFFKLNASITLGTDSLASSPTLSILDQMKIIIKNFPSIPFSHILKWATQNGALALGFEKQLGSIEFGKSPGLNLIAPFDFNESKPTATSKVRKLI